MTRRGTATILGHATGRLLLKRPGYEIDIQRAVEHARANGCSFEINRDAGVKIAITTDALAIRQFDYIRGGVDQARRAGLGKEGVLNCLGWPEFSKAIRR